MDISVFYIFFVTSKFVPNMMASFGWLVAGAEIM
jgi:hypothetical protein